jgi:SprT protein
MAETFQTWIRDWSSLWRTPGLPDAIHITFSPRLRASLGRCSPRTGSIRLNPGLLEADPAILREVVCHEAAHVAAWLLHGRRARPHGREWKDLMRAAGYEPRVRWPHQALPEALRRRARPAPRRRRTRRPRASGLDAVLTIAKRLVADWGFR